MPDHTDNGRIVNHAETKAHTSDRSIEDKSLWEWRKQYLLRENLAKRSSDAASIIKASNDAGARRIRRLAAETVVSLEMRRLAKGDTAGGEHSHLLERIIEHHPRLESVSAAIRNLALLADVFAVVSLILWAIHGFILINPFLSALVIAASPFAILMARIIDKTPLNGNREGQIDGDLGHHRAA